MVTGDSEKWWKELDPLVGDVVLEHCIYMEPSHE